MKSQRTKKYTLKKRTSQRMTNFFKRVFFSPAQEEFQNFSPTLQKKIKTPQRTVLTRTDIATNINRFGQRLCELATATLRTDRRASGNSGFKKLGVQWLIEHSTSHQHLWWLDSFVLRNPQLLKPANR